MKRPKFNISLNGELKTTKNAWNTACREIPKIVRNHITSGTAWEVSRQTEKLDPWHFKSGAFEWETSSGEKLTVKIELLEPQ